VYFDLVFNQFIATVTKKVVGVFVLRRFTAVKRDIGEGAWFCRGLTGAVVCTPVHTGCVRLYALCTVHTWLPLNFAAITGRETMESIF
jgi:hypothetical protein